jgi:hypothetical protein
VDLVAVCDVPEAASFVAAWVSPTQCPSLLCLCYQRRGAPQDAVLTVLAAEKNLSETAVVAPVEDGTFTLRWFTPAGEVSPLHAAAAAAANNSCLDSLISVSLIRKILRCLASAMQS